MRLPDPATVFSEVAPFWRDAPARSGRIARRVVGHLRSGGNVLDVGCGTGSVLAHVRAEARLRGRRVGRTVGVDLAEGMAARAGRRSAVRPVVGDAMALPFIDQYFDVVIAADVMQFVADPARTVRELFRVTMPGGTIVIELAPGRVAGLRRAELLELPRWSLLRRYVEMRRTYAGAETRRALESLGCVVREVPTRRHGRYTEGSLLTRLGRASSSEADLRAARRLRQTNGDGPAPAAPTIIVARLPGPRRGRMRISVEDLARWTPARVASVLHGLPAAVGYDVVVKPLRWRKRPHVQALCEFDRHRIVIQVPLPFLPFSEDVPYRAKRIRRGRRWHFRWYWRRLHFDRPDELIRYLYLHEYYHWYLREVRGRRAMAETACDRFALQQLGRGRGGYANNGLSQPRATQYGSGRRLIAVRTRIAAKGSRRSG
jgi:ubiquinone/menaquinone biosynthesis C-methylase UbiE